MGGYGVDGRGTPTGDDGWGGGGGDALSYGYVIARCRARKGASWARARKGARGTELTRIARATAFARVFSCAMTDERRCVDR